MFVKFPKKISTKKETDAENGSCLQ